MNLPNDFGEKARREAADCPYVLTERTTGSDLIPGTAVLGRDNDIEKSFGPGKTVRMVVVGFTKPHGYACCIDRQGIWWNVHPEALTEDR